jgi:uncharacterized membrane protein YgdD (TMEM256/DUF423 family)
MRHWALALVVVAGLLGAAGVSAAAAAAHISATAGMNAIAQVGMVHGAALLGMAAFAQRLSRPLLALVAATAVALGAGLFCGELALRGYAGLSLFPMAAPIAGTMIIVGWLLVAVAAVKELFVRNPTGN